MVSTWYTVDIRAVGCLVHIQNLLVYTCYLIFVSLLEKSNLGASEFLIQMSLANKFSKLTVNPKPQNVWAARWCRYGGIWNPSSKSEQDSKPETKMIERSSSLFVDCLLQSMANGTLRFYDTLREGPIGICWGLLWVSSRERKTPFPWMMMSFSIECSLWVWILTGISQWSLIDIIVDSQVKNAIDKQRGYGLRLASWKGPIVSWRIWTKPTVYLEMYYKHGEWELNQGYSSYIDEAMDTLEREMGEGQVEWVEPRKSKWMLHLNKVKRMSESKRWMGVWWQTIPGNYLLQRYNALHGSLDNEHCIELCMPSSNRRRSM